MSVDTARKDYSAMLLKWARLRDCTDGRDAVLKAGVKYVPDLHGASKDQNDAYRARGSFYNATGRTVSGMNGMIFQTSPEVEVPESQKEILDDITLTNVTFESFATQTGKEIFITGRYGVLVDMPVKKPGDTTLDVDMRPYCVGYTAEQIVNWRTERRGGDDVLTMLVLKEDVEVEVPNTEKDQFTSATVCQYRALYLVDKVCKLQLYRQKEGTQGAAAAYVRYEEEVTLMRRGEALTFIPFIFFGAIKPTAELELPPLLDLADVNLGHWRNSVDHEYGLHLVALPTPWVAGAKGTGEGNQMKIGPSVVWELDVQGSAGMLEFQGTGLKALVEAMDEKKKQMATLGARLLEDQADVKETATAVRMRHSGEGANLRTIAQSLEQGFTLMLQICCWWNGTDPKPSDVEVEVELNKEYMNIKATPEEIQVGLTALQAGEISFETWYAMLVTGGWARKGVTAEDEKKEIAKDKSLKPEPPEDPTLSPPAE